MLRWLRWGAQTVATALLVSFLSIWTTGYIVNSYMETLLKQLDLPLQTQPFALSGVWGKLWGADSAPNKTEASAPQNLVTPTPADHSRGFEPSPSGNLSPPGKAAPDTLGPDAASPKPASPETVSPNPANPNAANPETASPDTASPAPSDDKTLPAFGGNAGLSEMTEQQRQMLSSVMSKLSAGQLSQLTVLLENGLTTEELAQVGELIQPSLSEEEYKQLIDLLQTRTTEQSPVSNHT